MSRRAVPPPPPQSVAASLAEANRRDALEWHGFALWCRDPALETRAKLMHDAHQKAARAWERLAESQR